MQFLKDDVHCADSSCIDPGSWESMNYILNHLRD